MPHGPAEQGMCWCLIKSGSSPGQWHVCGPLSHIPEGCRAPEARLFQWDGWNRFQTMFLPTCLTALTLHSLIPSDVWHLGLRTAPTSKVKHLGKKRWSPKWVPLAHQLLLGSQIIDQSPDHPTPSPAPGPPGFPVLMGSFLTSS